MLNGLTQIGMWLVRALTRQVAPGADDPQWTGPRISFPPGCNPITVFVRLARGVRLAVSLRMKIEQEISDLLAGKPLSPVVSASQSTLTDHAGDEEVEDIEELEELEAPERPEALIRESPERLRESDRFHKLLNGPLKDAVAAICSDFGLTPDWSHWTEDGFPPPPGGEVEDWPIFRTPQGDAARPPDRHDDRHDGWDDNPDGVGTIIWRPAWRRPRRPRRKVSLDPRCQRAPAHWPDFNDFHFSDAS